MPGDPPCDDCFRTARSVLLAAIDHVDEPIVRRHRPREIGPVVCEKCGMFWPCQHVEKAIGGSPR